MGNLKKANAIPSNSCQLRWKEASSVRKPTTFNDFFSMYDLFLKFFFLFVLVISNEGNNCIHEIVQNILLFITHELKTKYITAIHDDIFIERMIFRGKRVCVCVYKCFIPGFFFGFFSRGNLYNLISQSGNDFCIVTNTFDIVLQ